MGGGRGYESHLLVKVYLKTKSVKLLKVFALCAPFMSLTLFHISAGRKTKKKESVEAGIGDGGKRPA